MLIFSIFALLALYITNTYIGSHFKEKKVYWFFELSHFLGGFLIALFLSNFSDDALNILYGVFLVGLFWEVYELTIDRSKKIRTFLSKFGIRQSLMTLPDTLLDLFLDMLGAFIFIKFFL